MGALKIYILIILLLLVLFDLMYLLGSARKVIMPES